MGVRFDQLDQQWKKETQWKTLYRVLRGTNTNGLSKYLQNGSITVHRKDKQATESMWLYKVLTTF